MDVSRNPTFARLAAMWETRAWMLLGTRRCQVGSNEGGSIVDVSRNPTFTRLAAMWETRAWMLLGTRRYQVGSDGGKSIVDASRNPMLPGWNVTPGWQRWKKLDRGCFQEPDC